MKKLILLLALAPVAALVWWAIHQKTQPPEVNFTTARRETLISSLITNGKAEGFSLSEAARQPLGFSLSSPSYQPTSGTFSARAAFINALSRMASGSAFLCASSK